MLANWVAPAIDVTLERLGLFTRCRNRPVREGADGVATLKAVSLAPVVEHERNRTRRRDASAKAFDFGVVCDPVAARGCR